MRSRLRTAIAACVSLVFVLNLGAPAFASQLSDKKAQAAAVQAQIEVLDNKTELAAEQFNAARDRHDALTVKVTATQKRLRQLRSQTATLQKALATQADEMYRTDGSFGVIAALLSAESIEELSSTIELITRIGEQNASTIDKLKGLEREAAVQERQLVVAQSSAAKEQAAMAAKAKDVRARLAERSAVFAALSSDIKKIIAKQKADEAAAARARYRALQAGRASSGGGSFDPGGNPPTSSKGARAVWYAETRLGRPYVWGASGPSTFDCSGLTMWAYRQAGVSLPHYSGGQIGVGSRVSRENLQPGDLVFFGSPIHHVGMYVGGGSFIEAPHSGAVVRITSLSGRSDYVGASRP